MRAVPWIMLKRTWSLSADSSEFSEKKSWTARKHFALEMSL